MQRIARCFLRPCFHILSRSIMSTASIASLDALVAAKTAAGEAVKNLKENKATAQEVFFYVRVWYKKIADAVAKLNKVKEEIEVLTGAQKAEDAEKKRVLAQFRADVEDVCRRRFIFTQSFEIYGGYGGLFDYGPIGCTLKENFLSLWRRHFVLEEEMLEISTVCMTPEPILKASGHVDRFTDLMVKDEKTGDCFRADKLLENYLDTLLEDVSLGSALKTEYATIRVNAGALDAAGMKIQFDRFKIVSPDTGNTLSDPFPYNLMFATSIGPTGKIKGFLRPETAQGIFTNFRRLLDSNNGKMPFASAQIGLAFRNEIAPRSGLLRVREFQMAEIEHFVNPHNKTHPRFNEVANVVLNLYSRELQADGLEQTMKMSVGEAVSKGIINNETLGYFLARTHLLLIRVGIKGEKLRFRQHLSNEMAHYAKDCWDAEIHTSYGWVECVGHADRDCYDLVQHSKHSGAELFALEIFPEPRFENIARFDFNRGIMGKVFKKEQQTICDAIKEMNPEDLKVLDETLKSTGKYTLAICTGTYELTAEMVKISFVSEKISSRRYVPSVIEPSFGIGRILYALIEHAFWTREADEQRKVMSFSPVVAPIKCYVFPLSGNAVFAPFVKEIYRSLLDLGLFTKVDDSGAALGRRYARTDEIGVPFAVTIDFQTEKDRTVTIRERDSTLQIRLSISDVPKVMSSLVSGELSWKEAMDRYPKFEQQEV